ncbi:MAG: baseplate J/gp47 family protein [Bryobacteraceae bacterium]
MNAETSTLIDRPYGEIVEDLLVALVGGVVNEPILFDVKNSRYPLAEPSTGIRGATGTFEKRHTQFQLEVDFSFSEADNALIWREEGRHPDDESTFFVDYFRRFSDSPVTDTNVGSVVRTINEAVARETAFLYQQINQVYLSAFIDTATGKSLDLVVSILGVVRKSSEFAEGLVTFFRDPAAGDGNISVPEGTLLRTNKGEATFSTAQLRTLQRGQVRIDVPVRAAEGSKGPDGIVAAGLINTLVQPITGIARVTNFDATILGEADETDEELRARAKAAVRSLGKATLASIQRVIAEERATLIDIYDPNIEGKRSDSGTVTALVKVTPGRFESLRNAVEDTRAAGVRVAVLAQQIYLKPRVKATLRTAGLTKQGELKVRGEIVEAIGAYLDSLETGAPAPGSDLLGAVKSVEEVDTAGIADVIVRRLDLSKLPGTSLLPARELILNESGGPVADADFGDGPTFQIITDAAAPTEWFFVLDMDPEADIEIAGGAA